MATKQSAAVSHCMTQKTMDTFIQSELDKGASENMIRRFRGTLKVIYEFLPDDKCITKERLIEWRKSMENNGYASITILNYVKYINRYVDFVGCSELRFNRGNEVHFLHSANDGHSFPLKPMGRKPGRRPRRRYPHCTAPPEPWQI